MTAGEGCGKEEGECEGRSGGWEYVERERKASQGRGKVGGYGRKKSN